MPETAAERRKENFGVTRSITFGRVYDSRDNVYDPHEGKRIGYSVEWAGGMGGDGQRRRQQNQQKQRGKDAFHGIRFHGGFSPFLSLHDDTLPFPL